MVGLQDPLMAVGVNVTIGPPDGCHLHARSSGPAKPSTIAPVISAVQSHGEGILSGLFKLTRNYCHGLHKARVGMLETE